MTEPESCSDADRPVLTIDEAWAIASSDDQPDQLVAWAQNRLTLGATLSDRREVRTLVQTMLRQPEGPSKRSLAYTLARVRLHPKRHAEVRRGLLEVALDKRASGSTRGEALDSLGAMAPWAGDEAMARRVIPLLSDPDPEVQFWTCYLLGTLRWRGAVPALRQLAETSTAVIPRWWSVAGEAEDAIAILEGREPADRTAGAPDDGRG